MCGIVAYLNTDDCIDCTAQPDLHAALKLIQHRGPDGSGIWIDSDGCVGFGHTRLSIIDLENGQQPMSNESGEIQLIVNGEFYNFEKIREDLEAIGHTFKTKSDSEIAIHLYEEHGLSFIDLLTGEFAFCLWDSQKSLLICVRDRFGIKPLYYTMINGRLLIASEIKAFLPLGLEPEWDIDSVVNSGMLLDSRTMFKGVKKLPAGHYMKAFRSGFIDVQKYWDSDYCDNNTIENRTIDDMVIGVRNRLEEAIRLRLRADVPVGVYLSGGIDSSCVLGIATKLLREQDPQAKLDVFTISFVDEKKLDESDIAERSASFCEANFHKLNISETELSQVFDDCIWHCEAPLCDLNSVAKFLLSKFVHEHGIKVVLTGEGSDEHFAGYSFFMADYLREDDRSFENFVDQRSIKLQSIESMSSMWESVQLRPISYTDEIINRRMLNGISSHRVRSSLFGLPNEMFTENVLKRTGQPDPCFTMATAIDGIARYKARTKWHPLHSALYIECHTILPNHILNHLGDRTEMAHSIESRLPFLDHHLTEYVNQLPPSLKIKYPIEKWILREAVKPYVTDEVYNRKKQPFVAPPAESKNTPHGIYLNKRLNRQAIEQLGWLRWDYVERLKRSFFENSSRQAQNVLNFILSIVIINERFSVKRYNIG